jgi:hypothetical protein
MELTKDEVLKALYDKYDLYYDADNPNSKDNDVYVHKHYKIITRGGIQKIEKKSGIKCEFNVVSASRDHCIIKGMGTLPDGLTYTTLGSASDLNSQNPYYPEMAEKRFRSRIVLTLAGLYQLGVFGEDEADDFSAKVSGEKTGVSIKKAYKAEA